VTKQRVLKFLSFLILLHWGLTLLFIGLTMSLEAPGGIFNIFAICLMALPGAFITSTAIRQLFSDRPTMTMVSLVLTFIVFVAWIVMWLAYGSEYTAMRDSIASQNAEVAELIFPTITMTGIFVFAIVQLLLMLIPVYTNRPKEHTRDASLINP